VHQGQCRRKQENEKGTKIRGKFKNFAEIGERKICNMNHWLRVDGSPWLKLHEI